MSEAPAGSRRSARWPWFRTGLTYAFFALVIGLLVTLARSIDWASVFRTLDAIPGRTLGLAAVAAVGSHLVYTSFDVLGKIYTRHHLPVSRIVPITFVCYVFNLNLSAWVGAIAARFRLYSRLGLPAAVITRVFTLSLMTNWLGYIVLAGAVFAAGRAPLLEGGLGAEGLRWLGVLLLLVAGTYLGACGFSKTRAFRIRKHLIELPTLRFACIQLILGSINWCLMALAIRILLGPAVSYPTVIAVLVISAIAGVVAHIPAGLGVMEAVFVALLADHLDKTSVLAALIGYRAVYFLLPLVAATLIFVVLEARAGRWRVQASSP
ncbi:MAG TPA: lysylphosphatidylglycerol synthase domain-containing protein [Polyangia bacterium]